MPYRCRYAVFAKVSPKSSPISAKAVSEDEKPVHMVRETLANIQDELIITEEPIYSLQRTTRGLIAFPSGKSKYFNSYKDLRECACEDGQYDRTQFPRRTNIEDKIITETKQKFPIAFEGRAINYLSFGAGYLLQDFILCMKLLLEGYSLNIRLIEINNNSEGFKKAYVFFVAELTKYAALLKKTIVVDNFATVDEYRVKYPKEVVDVAHAIDYSSSKYKAHQADPEIALIKQAVDAGKGNLYIFEGLTKGDEKTANVTPLATMSGIQCTIM